MKQILILFFMLFAFTAKAQVEFFDDVITTKSFEAKGTSKGSVACNEVTNTQMLAITSPKNGSCVYNTDKKSPFFYNSTQLKWKQAAGAGGDSSNKLLNGGFDDQLDSWTTSETGTATKTIAYETVTGFSSGEGSLAFTCTGGASGGKCLLYQDALTVGMTGLISINAHMATSLTGIKLIPRINEVPSETLFKEFKQGSDFYDLGVVMGDTKTGLLIEITVAASEVKKIVLDDAKVTVLNSFANIKNDSPTEDCGYTTSDFQGFGTVTNIKINCRQDGDTVHLSGSFVTGTVTAVEARMAVKLRGVAFKNSSLYALNEVVGTWFRGAADSSKGGTLLAFDDNAYLRFSTWNIFRESATNPLVESVATTVALGSQRISVNAVVTVKGLKSSSSALFQGNKYSDLKTHAFLSAQIDNTTIVQGSEWITSVTGTTVKTANIKAGTFTVKPICFIQGTQRDTLSSWASWSVKGVVSVSQISWENKGEVSQVVDITCFKTGQDAIDAYRSMAAMAIDAKNITGLARYIVKTYSSGTDWYEVNNDGWVRQGSLTLGGTFASRTTTLAVKMATSAYSVTATNYGSSASGASTWNGLNTRAMTTTTVTYTDGGDSGTKFLVIEGYGDSATVTALGATPSY